MFGKGNKVVGRGSREARRTGDREEERGETRSTETMKGPEPQSGAGWGAKPARALESTTVHPPRTTDEETGAPHIRGRIRLRIQAAKTVKGEGNLARS